MRPQIAVRQSDPPVVFGEQIEDQPHGGLRRAAPVVGTAHVVDDGGEFDLAKLGLDRQEIVTEAEDLDEPADLADAVEPAAEAGQARRQLEVAAEVEARPAHADAVEPVQFRVTDAVVDDGDPDIFSSGAVLSTSCIRL